MHFGMYVGMLRYHMIENSSSVSSITAYGLFMSCMHGARGPVSVDNVQDTTKT